MCVYVCMFACVYCFSCTCTGQLFAEFEHWSQHMVERAGYQLWTGCQHNHHHISNWTIRGHRGKAYYKLPRYIWGEGCSHPTLCLDLFKLPTPSQLLGLTTKHTLLLQLHAKMHFAASSSPYYALLARQWLLLEFAAVILTWENVMFLYTSWCLNRPMPILPYNPGLIIYLPYTRVIIKINGS